MTYYVGVIDIGNCIYRLLSMLIIVNNGADNYEMIVTGRWLILLIEIAYFEMY